MLQYTIRLGIAHNHGRARILSRPRSRKGNMDMPKIQPMSKKLTKQLLGHKMELSPTVGRASFSGKG